MQSDGDVVECHLVGTRAHSYISVSIETMCRVCEVEMGVHGSPTVSGIDRVHTQAVDRISIAALRPLMAMTLPPG